MYGPPPDPRSVPFPAGLGEQPLAWALCLVVGLLLSAAWLWRRPPEALRALLFTLGQTVLLTAPLLGVLDAAWYGDFPTIDKEGSLLFYLDGVHVRALLHPVGALQDPAVRLIGVHLGHLWPVALGDLFLSPMGAFNLSALLYPALGWWACWLLCRELCGDGRLALVAAMPFGLGLHVFRDLNWYTIEKASVFWLALYAFALLRSAREGGRWPIWAGLIYLVMSWWNLYLGLVGAVLGGVVGLALLPALRRPHPARGALWGVLASAAFALPLVVAQALLMRGGPSLGTPEQFLWERAALDSFTLWPPRWNRLELWAALSPPLLLLGLWSGIVERRRPEVLVGLAGVLLLGALSLGPSLLPGVKNPLYLGAVRLVPGLWRMAKPEVFFEGAWLLILALAALGLVRLVPRQRVTPVTVMLYVISVGLWLLTVRAHPAFPSFHAHVESRLSPGWEKRVFRAEE